ncbi:MAG: response regulator [Desulfobacterales bacterium]|nr:response regulator [Desulfobacterales bacterium]
MTATGGKEAVDVYEKNRDKIDLVVLDMIMPDMTGSEVFERIREINPDVKVMLSSCYALNDQAAGIMEKGCNGFIMIFNTPTACGGVKSGAIYRNYGIRKNFP